MSEREICSEIDVIKEESPAPPTAIRRPPTAEGGLGLPTDSIHRKEPVVNTSSENILSEEDQNLLFDEEFYGRYENESKEEIVYDIDELKMLKGSEELSDGEVAEINAQQKALEAGYSTLHDYYVETAKKQMLDDYAEKGEKSQTYRLLEEKRKKAKETTNFSLKENAGADGKRPTSYTKEEARALVDRVMELFSGEGYSGALPGKRAEAIQRAHALLNGAEPGKRASAALDFADYLIRSAVLEDDVTANPDYELHVRTMEALKPYLRRLDLESIREEIYFRYDDKARAVFTRWGKTKNAETLG